MLDHFRVKVKVWFVYVCFLGDFYPPTRVESNEKRWIDLNTTVSVQEKEGGGKKKGKKWVLRSSESDT